LSGEIVGLFSTLCFLGIVYKVILNIGCYYLTITIKLDFVKKNIPIKI
jgi:hypothetical protein